MSLMTLLIFIFHKTLRKKLSSLMKSKLELGMSLNLKDIFPNSIMTDLVISKLHLIIFLQFTEKFTKREVLLGTQTDLIIWKETPLKLTSRHYSRINSYFNLKRYFGFACLNFGDSLFRSN